MNLVLGIILIIGGFCCIGIHYTTRQKYIPPMEIEDIKIEPDIPTKDVKQTGTRTPANKIYRDALTISSSGRRSKK